MPENFLLMLPKHLPRFCSVAAHASIDRYNAMEQLIQGSSIDPLTMHSVSARAALKASAANSNQGQLQHHAKVLIVEHPAKFSYFYPQLQFHY